VEDSLSGRYSMSASTSLKLRTLIQNANDESNHVMHNEGFYLPFGSVTTPSKTTPSNVFGNSSIDKQATASSSPETSLFGNATQNKPSLLFPENKPSQDAKLSARVSYNDSWPIDSHKQKVRRANYNRFGTSPSSLAFGFPGTFGGPNFGSSVPFGSSTQQNGLLGSTGTQAASPGPALTTETSKQSPLPSLEHQGTTNSFGPTLTRMSAIHLGNLKLFQFSNILNILPEIQLVRVFGVELEFTRHKSENRGF
jgi:hypothetical protein